MQFNPYVDFVNYVVGKRNLYKRQGKSLLQTLFEKTINSVHGGNNRRDVNDQFICVTEKWTSESYEDRVEEWWLMKNVNLIVKLEDDAGVDDEDIPKSIN